MASRDVVDIRPESEDFLEKYVKQIEEKLFQLGLKDVNISQVKTDIVLSIFYNQNNYGEDKQDLD